LTGPKDGGRSLEHNLIKHHRPRGNRALTVDDDGYCYIALTAEDLPRLIPYRKRRTNRELERGGTTTTVARLFGPYVSRRLRDALLKFAADAFRLRTCAPLAREVCLRYHLGACGGVCEQRVTARDYADAVSEAVAFLARRQADALRLMKRQMAGYADRLQSERAAWVQRHVEALERALEPQVVERDIPHDQDVQHFGPERVLLMHVRRGAVLGLSLCELEPARGADEHVDRFVRARYGRGCPGELIANRVGDRRGLERALTAANGYLARAMDTRGSAARPTSSCGCVR
jgi:excinuclease ABC subunit C